jgi:hypothetical protein
MDSQHGPGRVRDQSHGWKYQTGGPKCPHGSSFHLGRDPHYLPPATRRRLRRRKRRPEIARPQWQNGTIPPEAAARARWHRPTKCLHPPKKHHFIKKNEIPSSVKQVMYVPQGQRYCSSPRSHSFSARTRASPALKGISVENFLML